MEDEKKEKEEEEGWFRNCVDTAQRSQGEGGTGWDRVGFGSCTSHVIRQWEG